MEEDVIEDMNERKHALATLNPTFETCHDTTPCSEECKPPCKHQVTIDKLDYNATACLQSDITIKKTQNRHACTN